MKIQRTTIPGVLIVSPGRFEDERGFFSEIHSRVGFREAGIDIEFIQDNFSFNSTEGTVRGLHFQNPPHAQDKLVWVPKGSILDVALDLRLGSPTFGEWTSHVISGANWNQILVPAGCAHGFCTLERGTHVCYKVSTPYAPESEGGLLWNDPELGIEWPKGMPHLVSARDREMPRFKDFQTPFRYLPPQNAAEKAP